MSFNRKMIIAFILANVVFISFGLLYKPDVDYSRLTDQDLVVLGVTEKVLPVLSILWTSIVFSLIYIFKFLIVFVVKMFGHFFK